MKENIKIFYSWQSDLSDDTNKRAIRDMLKKAKSKIEHENKDNINIIIDEATRDEIGSPNIPLTIIKKINEADIFTADVSIVNNSSDTRKMPNPNVMYELGYAVGKLGWERVILLSNNCFGDVKDMPFDIDRHRIMTYSICEDVGTVDLKSLIGSSANGLYKQISNILNKNSDKECAEIQKTEEEIKRDKDIKNIEIFLSSIQLEIIDDFIKDTPRIINGDIFFFFEHLDCIASSSSFHMYNKDLYDLFVKFHDAWSTILSYPSCYHDINNATRHVWYNPGDMPLNDDKQKVWDDINEARGVMKGSLNAILRTLRENYVKIDIDGISKKNHQELIEFKKQQVF